MSDPHPRILAALIAHQRADPGVCTCGWIWNGNGTHSGHVAEQLQPIIDDARAETAERASWLEGRLMSLRRLRHWAGTHQPDNQALLDRIDQQTTLAENDLAKLGEAT